jgi:hypothetical protein
MARLPLMILSFIQFLSINETRSQAVELVQAGLKALGEPWAGMLGRTGPGSDGIDGELGPKTREALELFLQKADPSLRTGSLSDANIKSLGIGSGPAAGLARSGKRVLFVHGLTKDLAAGDQAALLKKGLGSNVETFSYKGDIGRVGAAVKADPSATVVLYSAGCFNAAEVARLMQSAGADLRQLWCLEPYARGTSTVRRINDAISMGMPESNVITGPALERGGGKSVWPKAGQTPAGKNHFSSLTAFGELIARR